MSILFIYSVYIFIFSKYLQIVKYFTITRFVLLFLIIIIIFSKNILLCAHNINLINKYLYSV